MRKNNSAARARLARTLDEFLIWRGLPNDNEEFPILRFKRKREQPEVNLSFSNQSGASTSLFLA